MLKDVFNITVRRKGKLETYLVGPDFNLSTAWDNRISGLRREIAVKYCVLRDGNRCSLKTAACVMGDNPFPDPLHADLDHIIPAALGGKSNAGNVRLVCHPCNSYEFARQLFHWKTKPAAGSAQIESERESPPRAHAWTSREGEQGEKQQAYWDDWIQRDDKDSPWVKLGVKRGSFVRLTDLLDMAPREIGRLYTISKQKFGSSVTYRRYAMEDRFTVLELSKDRGEWWVRLVIK